MASRKTKARQRTKSGKEFEELIAWIQQSTHQQAEIRRNEKLLDIDTGKLRQVDITIRLSDGPTNFLGIVEVRDRSRPIGVRYVEEVFGKRRSVRADAAFLVSHSGFTRTAITKAAQLGIRALAYAEAQRVDGSCWLQCQTFSVLCKKYDRPMVFFLEYGTDEIIDVSGESMAAFRYDPAAKVVLDEQGTPVLSAPDLVAKVINTFGERPYKDIATDGSRTKRTLLFDGQFEPSLWLKAEDDTLRRIGKVRIEVELYWESQEYPLNLTRYREVTSRESIAELATTEVEISGQRYRFEILAPRAGEYIPEGSTVVFRSSPLKGDA